MNNLLSEEFIKSFYSIKLPSFQSYSETVKIMMNHKDFYNLIKNYNTYINNVYNIKGHDYDEVALDIAQYHQGKQFL